MKIETLTLERHERRQPDWALSAARILPERRPRFCVQMIPGFSDRKERWYPLMQFVAACGGVALIQDLRGQGSSLPLTEAKNPEDAVADMGYDWETLRDDIDAVYQTYGDPFGDAIEDPAENRLLPRFLFGHSMGSMAAALYAARRSASLDGLILAGLPHREGMISPALFGLGLLALFSGDAARPKGLNRRAFTRFNRTFDPEPGSDGQFLWLTNDPAVRQAFAADPLCNRLHPLGDYRTLLRMVRDVWKSAMWDKPADIPVLLMAGELDPVAGGDDAMIRAGKFLADMGFSSVDERMYRGLRHEIFMDDGRQTPFSDLARFCLTHLPGKELSGRDPSGSGTSAPSSATEGDAAT